MDWLTSTTVNSKQAQKKLLWDVAEFLFSVLQLKYQNVFENRPQTFQNLIICDGQATFHHFYGLGNSLVERRAAEAARSLLEERLEALCHFVDTTKNFLKTVGRLVQESILMGTLNDTVDTAPAVASENGVPGYFARVFFKQFLCGERSIHTQRPRVEVAPPVTRFNDDLVFCGGFSLELSKILEAPVSEWLQNLEKKLAELVPEDLQTQRCDDEYLTKARDKLTRLLSDHIAMVGFFREKQCYSNVPTIELEYVGVRLSTETMDGITREILEEEMPRVYRIHEDDVLKLKSLRMVCTDSLEVAAEAVYERKTAILSCIRTPPPILNDRLVLFRDELDRLSSIIRNAPGYTPALLIAQISEWRKSAGKQAVKMASILSGAIDRLKSQLPPTSGFLPTLRFVQPPEAGWVDSSSLVETYIETRLSLPVSKLKNESTMRMPASAERVLRLVSIVWELLACEPTRDLMFTPGRVKIKFLRDVLSIEEVNLNFATSQLHIWIQTVSLGRNFRGASRAITNFRGSEFENEVWEKFAKLSHWNLADLMSVVSEEKSPVFLRTQWKLVDALAAVMMQNGMAPVHCSGVLGRVLDVCEPMIKEMRLASTIHALARPHHLGQLLRALPKVRAWASSGALGDELVLTVDDVQQTCSKQIKTTLLDLSSQRSIVHFGRLSRARGSDHGYGSKRVFRFNGNDLRAVLFGEVVEEVDKRVVEEADERFVEATVADKDAGDAPMLEDV